MTLTDTTQEAPRESASVTSAANQFSNEQEELVRVGEGRENDVLRGRTM